MSLLPPYRRALAAAAVGFVASSAAAADIGAYQPSRTFALPASTGTVLFDALPDGRLITLDGNAVAVETAPGSGAFAALGGIPGFAPAFGPSFLAVSPDGIRAAAGSNGGGSVVVFNLNDPTAVATFAVNDYDAAWLDDSRLAISSAGAMTSQVQLLDTGTNALSTVVTNLSGAGGVAFDANGNLYAGTGFGANTGLIRAFSPAQLSAAVAAGVPLDFAGAGVAVADLLSAASLGFDGSGNFLVGGADFFGGSGDLGYAGLVSADAIAAALSGGPVVTPAAPADVLRKFLSPPSTIDNFQSPSLAFNEATGELYLRYFGDGTVQVFVVPEPSTLALVGLAGALLRRRRRIVTATAVATLASAAARSAAYTYDANDFAVEVVGSTGLPATGLYNDPAAALGRPTLRFDNSANPAAPDVRRATLIESVFNVGPAGGRLLTTIANGTSLTVRMGRPVTDDANNPFGVDFLVFGNTFYAGNGGFTGDDADLNAYTIGGSLFAERTKVSVSPDNVNWYRYDAGPYADSAYPTNGYLWDAPAAAWTDVESDPTLPVEPGVNVAGMTAAAVLEKLYRGSAGGTGFDLAASGFASIQYVRVEGLPGFAGGEVDAFADVAPQPVPEPAAVAALAAPLVASRRRR